MLGFFTGSAGRSGALSVALPLTPPLTEGVWLEACAASELLPSCEWTETDDVEFADDGAAGRDFGLASGADMSVSHRRSVSVSKPVSAVVVS